MEVFTFIISSVGLFFFGLSFSFKSFKRGTPFGIKNKWTNMSDYIWDKTHMVSGKVWKVTGLLISTTPILVKKSTFIGMIFLIALIVFTVVFPYAYSYFLYKNYKENNIE